MVAAQTDRSLKLRLWTAAEVLAKLRTEAERQDGCLLLPLRRADNTGYVKVNAGGRGIRAHRLVAAETLGRPLLSDETVDHVCHNNSDCNAGAQCPHRRCIEPSHLDVVDQPTNWRRGRLGAPARRAALTHCPAGHPYEPANLVGGNDHRVCKACHRARKGGRDPRQEPTYLP